MPDYGHPLVFGTFITPVNSPAQAAVQRARLSEQLGYDLVTFQVDGTLGSAVAFIQYSRQLNQPLGELGGRDVGGDVDVLPQP